MDVKLSDEQQALLRSVKGALDRHHRTNPRPHPSEADVPSLEVLQSGGYLDILATGGTAVDALLVVEQAAASAPGAPVGARAFVGPLVTERQLPGCIALVERPSGSIARFAPMADALLIRDGDTAIYMSVGNADIERLESRWGYPVGRVSAVRRGESLGPGSGERLLRAWQTALAAEAGGLMEAAVLHSSEYVSHRQQFGRMIGSLQSIQHRLAHAYVKSQGAKWLARRAAWDPSDALAAAAAGTYATEAIREVMSTCQQVCGAIGITDEFGLTRYTSRMAWLQTELGGPIAQARDLARVRWTGRVAAAAPAGGGGPDVNVR